MSLVPFKVLLVITKLLLLNYFTTSLIAVGFQGHYSKTNEELGVVRLFLRKLVSLQMNFESLCSLISLVVVIDLFWD